MIMSLKSVSALIHVIGYPKLIRQYSLSNDHYKINDVNHFGGGGLSRPLKLEGQRYQSRFETPPEHVKFLTVENNRCIIVYAPQIVVT